MEKSEAGRLISSEEIFRGSGFLAGWVTYERNLGHRRRRMEMIGTSHEVRKPLLIEPERAVDIHSHRRSEHSKRLCMH